jgi:ribonuclease P protein subunit POP4
MRSSSRKSAADVARHELIGLEVAVESPHRGWHGLSGTVVDETKHTFLVETASGSRLLVPKAGQGFVFRVGEQRLSVRGDEIRFRPEDRTKKVRG